MTFGIFVGYYGYVGSVSKSTESPFLRNNLLTKTCLAPHDRLDYGIYFLLPANAIYAYTEQHFIRCRVEVDGHGGTSTGILGGRYKHNAVYNVIDVGDPSTSTCYGEYNSRPGILLSESTWEYEVLSPCSILKSDECVNVSELRARSVSNNDIFLTSVLDINSLS